MQNVITIGRRLIPLEQIALVEPFDPSSNPEFKPEKDFKARVVLLNRDIVLAEITPEEFAEAHGFRVLEADNMAINPAISFQVETFEPTETFKPEKPYVTRLKWRDLDGNSQSKLLLTEPESVIAVVLRGGAGAAPARADAQRRSSRRPALVRS